MAITKEDGSIVAAEAERADTLLSQVVGLMFRKSIPESYALVFSMKRDKRGMSSFLSLKGGMWMTSGVIL